MIFKVSIVTRVGKSMGLPKEGGSHRTTCVCPEQSQIFARQGVEIDRSTLANWVGGACWWLEPLHNRLAEHVFASQKLFADDTPIPLLDPGRGR